MCVLVAKGKKINLLCKGFHLIYVFLVALQNQEYVKNKLEMVGIIVEDIQY